LLRVTITTTGLERHCVSEDGFMQCDVTAQIEAKPRIRETQKCD